MYIYAVMQLFSGVLADRFGGWRVIKFGGLFFCAGALAFPLFHSLTGMIFARILLGFGASLLYLSIVSELLRYYGKNGGIAISLVVLTGFTGGVFANAPFALLAERFGWRNILLGIGIFASVGYLLFFIFASHREAAVMKKRRRGIRRGYWVILRKRDNLVMFAMSAVNFGLYYVIQTVLGKKFLEDCGGYSPAAAAWILSGMGLIAACSGCVIAMISRRINNRRRGIFITAGLVSVLCFPAVTLTLILCGTGAKILALFFCLLATTSTLSSIVLPYLKEKNPPELSGTAASVCNCFFYISVAFFGNLTGWVMGRSSAIRDAAGNLVYSRGTYIAVFGILSLFSCLVLYLALRIRDPRIR